MFPNCIELWSPDRLIPYDRNARQHSREQIAQIAASIEEFGFTNPILVDSKAGIVAGHARLEAARRLSLPEVPVIVLDHLSDVQKRAYILADNKLAESATWDDELLRIELDALKTEDFDVSLTGFSAAEIDLLLQSVECPNLTDEDDAPSADERVVSQLADVWELGPHRLLAHCPAPARNGQHNRLPPRRLGLRCRGADVGDHHRGDGDRCRRFNPEQQHCRNDQRSEEP